MQADKQRLMECHESSSTLSRSKEADLPVGVQPIPNQNGAPIQYRLYKRRFAGLAGFVILNLIAAMSWSWFGPISNETAHDFHITLDQVNWIGNMTGCVYLLAAPLTPVLCSRFGIRRSCDVAMILLVLSAWVRYSGTVKTLSTGSAYALLLIGQLFSAITQAIAQILGPKYSETWFGLKGRTTATMVIAVSNPLGSALGQIISPSVGNPRHSILVLGVLSTVIFPFIFIIADAPPTPPTYAGSQPSQSIMSLVRALLGMSVPSQAYMTPRERIDFILVSLVFGILDGVVNAFSLLSAQFASPAGYSSNTSGFMSATILLSGIVAAGVTAPLFDRVFTHHLALTVKILLPIVSAAWLSLVWAVIPNNTAALFSIMAIIGVCSLTMLPVGLELGVELTRNADASTAILWFSGNLFGIIFVEAEGALRAGPDAHPPLNMRRALIFNAVFTLIAACIGFGIRGKQARRELDEEKDNEKTP